MSAYTDLVASMRAKLRAVGYELRLTQVAMNGVRVPVEVTFPATVFDVPLVAIPDVHLGDGTGADIFAHGALFAHKKRLADFLRVAGFALTDEYGGALEMVQLGDWYDIWRAYPRDLETATYERIESVYEEIVRLDADIGLKHLIGNHDAALARALSGYRSSQPEQFPFASWLAGGTRVLSLHGHQVDSMRLDDAPDGPTSSNVIAWVSGVARNAGDGSLWRAVENAYDKSGFPDALLTWLKGAFFGVRPDQNEITTADRAAAPTTGSWIPEAQFAVNNDASSLVDIAIQIRDQTPAAADVPLRALVVGHSHLPRVAWAPLPTSADPVVIIDVGSWTYGAANVLVAAGDAAGVYDVAFVP